MVRTCDHCGTTGDRLKRCRGCGRAWYCDKACQTAAWPAHRPECQRRQNEVLALPSTPPHLLGHGEGLGGGDRLSRGSQALEDLGTGEGGVLEGQGPVIGASGEL